MAFRKGERFTASQANKLMRAATSLGVGFVGDQSTGIASTTPPNIITTEFIAQWTQTSETLVAYEMSVLDGSGLALLDPQGQLKRNTYTIEYYVCPIVNGEREVEASEYTYVRSPFQPILALSNSTTPPSVFGLCGPDASGKMSTNGVGFVRLSNDITNADVNGASYYLPASTPCVLARIATSGAVPIRDSSTGEPAVMSGAHLETYCFNASDTWSPTAIGNFAAPRVAWATPPIEGDLVLMVPCAGVGYVGIPIDGGGRVFPIILTQTGGSTGSASTASSWTYSVQNAITGTLLGTGVNITASPHKFKRPSLGRMIAATFGLAYIDSTGALVVVYANEVIDVEACA